MSTGSPKTQSADIPVGRPSRGAAIKASAYFSNQLQSDDSDEGHGKEADPESDPFGEPVRAKGRGPDKRQYGRKSIDGPRSGTTSLSSRRKRTTAPKPANVPANASTRKATATPAAKHSNARRKRPRESTPSDSEREREWERVAMGYSDLTPLSSPIGHGTSIGARTPVKGTNSRSNKASTPKRTPTRVKALSTSLSASTSALSPRSRYILPGTAPASRHVQSSSSLAPIGRLGSNTLGVNAGAGMEMGTGEDGMGNTLKLDLFVWVLVDMDGKVVEDSALESETELDLDRLLDLDKDLDMNVDMGEQETNKDNNGFRMWWPGFKKQSHPLIISLFGEVTPGARCVQVEVRCPTKRNVRDVGEGSGFTKETFVVRHTEEIRGEDKEQEEEPAITNASPRKKHKTISYAHYYDADLEARWTGAVAAMREDQNDDDGIDDEMLGVEWTPSKVGKAKANGQGKGKGKGKADSAILGTIMVNRRRPSSCTPGESDNEEAKNWYPPPPDLSLDVPGEKVFAREIDKRGRSQSKSTAKPIKPTTKTNGKDDPTQYIYWPAILKYQKEPKAPGEVWVYGVTFLDGDNQEITRDMFFSSDQDEFALCELGVWESVINEVPADTDVDSDSGFSSSPASPSKPRRGQHQRQRPNHRLRPTSPIPLSPPPSPSTFSTTLTPPELLSYTKPILQAILNDVYPPAKQRHDDFLRGGAARASTQEAAAMRGTMGPEEVKGLQKCLSRWVLREGRKGGGAYKSVDVGVDGQVVDGDTKKLDQPDEEHDIVVPSSPVEPPPSSFSVPGDLVQDSMQLSPSSPQDMDAAQQPDANINENTNVNGKRTRPPPQGGCEGYERLTPPEKIGYCLNILLPEAVRQILLWREGERTSVALLSDAEEQNLYNIGETLLQKTDWVYDTMRMRDAKKRTLDIRRAAGGGGAKGVEGEGSTSMSGTKSRPRKGSVRYRD